MILKKNIMLTGFLMDSNLLKILSNLESFGYRVPVMLLGKGDQALNRQDIEVYYESDLYNPNSDVMSSVNVVFEELNFIRNKYAFILRCLSRWDKTLTNTMIKYFSLINFSFFLPTR